MDESTRWGSNRYLTLLAVITVHTALLAWLAAASHTRGVAANVPSESVQLLFIPPPSLPKVRLQSVQPLRLRSGTPVSVTPPPLDAPPSPAAEEPPRSGSKDGGSGVDWAAEERRALRAFEIRSHQPAINNSVSRRSPAEQPWWPAHRPGERYKTAEGNWIVWINSSCYQVATSSLSTSGSGPQPRTICPPEDVPDAEPADPAQ
jgi:hypothetical protein